MPRHVDPDERRQHIAHAAWRVILDGGLEAATVRNVAAEATLSVGSLRHYFAAQSDLLAFALHSVGERIRARVRRAAAASEDPRDRADRVLGELLPIDDERRIEAELRLAFVGRARVARELHAERAAAFDNTRQLCARVLGDLVTAGLAPADLDLDLETSRLHALVEGLALHGASRPDQVSADQVAATVAHHLDTLCTAPMAEPGADPATEPATQPLAGTRPDETATQPNRRGLLRPRRRQP